NGIAFPVSEIEKAFVPWVQRQNMGLRKVRYMDVIPDAGPVRRGIIRPVNLAMRRLAHRYLEHVRDQMRFDSVMLAKAFARSSGIEVTKRNESQPVNLPIPEQDLFKHQLGFAIRIDGTLRQILALRHALRRPV